MAESHGNKPGGRTNRLVALSSAAVLTVYAAGYLRTRAAADRLQAADRPRIVIPDGPGDWSAGPVRKPELPVEARAKVPAGAPASLGPDVTGDRVKKPAGNSPATSASAPTETPVAATADPAQLTPATPVAATAVAQTPVATTAVTAAAALATTPTPEAAATPAPTPTPTPTPTPAAQYKDGTYSGWGTSRHGDIEATVVIANGKITSAQITQCWTRYSCSWVAHLQGQVVTRQSPDVDYVSGATQSTNAFYYAVVQALSKAK